MAVAVLAVAMVAVFVPVIAVVAMLAVVVPVIGVVAMVAVFVPVIAVVWMIIVRCRRSLWVGVAIFVRMRMRLGRFGWVRMRMGVPERAVVITLV